MRHAEPLASLNTPEAICFTSDDSGVELQARLTLRSGLVVGLNEGGAGQREFRFDPAQADALGRWLVAKASEYRGRTAHVWSVVPVTDAMPAPGELAGFDTLDQAMAVVAGLSGLEVARGV